MANDNINKNGYGVPSLDEDSKLADYTRQLDDLRRDGVA